MILSPGNVVKLSEIRTQLEGFDGDLGLVQDLQPAEVLA